MGGPSSGRRVAGARAAEAGRSDSGDVRAVFIFLPQTFRIYEVRSSSAAAVLTALNRIVEAIRHAVVTFTRLHTSPSIVYCRADPRIEATNLQAVISTGVGIRYNPGDRYAEQRTSPVDIRPDETPDIVGKLLNAAVVPRPIAWVRTINADGQPNLAPFSFFNAVCRKPPTVLFCSSVRSAPRRPKDTQRNIVETGEFVINFVTEALAEAMNLTAVEAPPEVNEFERARLTAAPGTTVRVPHVAETPIYFECKLREIITISEEPGGAAIIIGTITFMHFDDSVYREGNYLDFETYRPVGRMTGAAYVRTGDVFEMQRPPSEIEP